MVDEIAGKYNLQLTCKNWNQGGSLSINETKTTSMVTYKVFSFLDLKLFWDNSGRLEFQVQRKKTNYPSI